MLKRILTGAALVIVLVPALIFYDTAVTPLVWAVIAAISLFEVAGCVGLADGKVPGGRALTVVICVLGAAFPIAQFALGWSSVGSLEYIPLFMSSGFFAVYLLYAVGVFGLLKLKISPRTELFLMFVYVSAAAVSIVSISRSEYGGFILPMVFIGSWITDSFAFFCGSFFGKHKLIPRVSPKKTVEGSVGGTVFCCIFTALYGFIVSKAAGIAVDYAALIGTGLLLSIVSQIGDLNASYIKREHGIKDFGDMFPGHGGMLDRFDSVIASVPFLYVLTKFFTYFR